MRQFSSRIQRSVGIFQKICNFYFLIGKEAYVFWTSFEFRLEHDPIEISQKGKVGQPTARGSRKGSRFTKGIGWYLFGEGIFLHFESSAKFFLEFSQEMAQRR